MKEIIGKVFVFLVVIVIIFMSVLLLSYNDYRVSQFGDNTLLIVDKPMHEYKEGSLLIIKKGDLKEIKKGDLLFFYDTSGNPVKTVLAQIKDVINNSQVEDDIDFVLPNDTMVNSKYVIGSTKTTKEYKKIGKVLGVLESKWGNLFLVVVPAFMLFMYELFSVILEAKVYKMDRM